MDERSQAGQAIVRVGDLLGHGLAELHFKVLGGEASLQRPISHPRVQKPGLAFAGYYEYIKAGRIQIIGESETEYLKTLSRKVRLKRFEKVVDAKVPAFIITKGLKPPDEFLELCRVREIPILQTPAFTSVTIKKVSFFLEDHLVPITRQHGVLIDLFSLGVLLKGPSGVGKSETGLELIARGHRLIADDLVTIKQYPNGELVGYGEEPSKYHIELRGLGIINVRDLFGLAAIRDHAKLDLVIELELWQEGKVYDRLGLDEQTYSILDTAVPYIRMPVASGRNVASLIEVAARNHVLKMQGHDSAREYVKRVEARLEQRRLPQP